jgi:pyruvate,water dikinase
MTQKGASVTLNFRDIGAADRPTVGGKGASLGELTRAGIRVPPGFVVSTAAFERFIAEIDPQGSIRRAIEGLSAGDLPVIAKVAEGVRARIAGACVPDDIRRAILADYAQLCTEAGDEPVAVRSSATSEDGAEASFAGLQDTYLWIRGGEGVLHAVRDCWASLYSAESVSYRLRLKLPEDGLAMGVVVQRMVASRRSGVMFTRSPLTGDRSVIAIESSWGLGSAVVSGVVTPDKVVVSKVTGEIVKRTVSHKTVEHVPDLAAGGVREVPVPEERRDAPCLDEAQIAELAGIGKRVEAHYRCPQDIEWAFAPDAGGAESLYLLQSRPETIWANRESKPAAAPKANAYAHVFDLLGGAKKS